MNRLHLLFGCFLLPLFGSLKMPESSPTLSHSQIPVLSHSKFRPGGTDYALFFAVEKYDNPSSWTKLTGLIGECEAIAKDLRELYGFETKVVPNPSFDEIDAELERWRAKTFGPDDQLLIFFSGHGQFVDGRQEGFFIPKDGKSLTAAFSERHWYSLLQMPRHVNSIKCNHIFLAIDACYSGTIGSGVAFKNINGEEWAEPTINKDQARNQYIHNRLRGQSRFMMTSGGKNKTKHPSDFVRWFRRTLDTYGGKDGILEPDDFDEEWPKEGENLPQTGVFEGHEANGHFMFVYQPKLNGGPLPNPDDPFENDMVLVEGGTFQMGCDPKRDSNCVSNEEPLHKVTLSTFYLSKFEVTVAQWRTVMGGDPRLLVSKECDNCPVSKVSWEDVQTFLYNLYRKTSIAYRLPTEAEWEFAARGGNQSKSYRYSGSNVIDEVAWHNGNSDLRTHPVGKKMANEMGLFDMSGNVWEWCSDYLGAYFSTPQKNPTQVGTDAITVRGGSYFSQDYYCRSATRMMAESSSEVGPRGFRLARQY